MPTINKLPKKKRLTENSEKRKERMKYYNTVKWQKLRDFKMLKNPICERCLDEFDKITMAEDVHHIVSFMSGNTDDEKKSLFFDFENLKSLCKKCHQQIHQMQNEK